MVLCPLGSRENIYVSLLKSHSNPVASNITQELPVATSTHWLDGFTRDKISLKAKNTFHLVLFYLSRLGQDSLILFYSLSSAYWEAFLSESHKRSHFLTYPSVLRITVQQKGQELKEGQWTVMGLFNSLCSCIRVLFSLLQPALLPDITHQDLCPIRIKMDRCADEIIFGCLIHWLPILLYQSKRHKTTLRNLVPPALRTRNSHWTEQFQKTTNQTLKML